MKVTIDENDFYLGITIVPETAAESSMLLRYERNRNSEKPDVFLSFRNEQYLSVSLPKKKKSVQEFTPLKK